MARIELNSKIGVVMAAIVLPVLVVTFATFVWVPTLNALGLEQDALAFAETPGRVVASDLAYATVRRSGSWQLRVEAAYAVGRTEYRATTFQPFGERYRAINKQDGERAAARYAVGATVPVYYDPGGRM